MNALEPADVQCPYCGEMIEILIDLSEEQQRYTEDCQVCCRPIDFAVSVDEDGEARVATFREDDA